MELRGAFGVRSAPDEVVPTRKSARRAEELSAQIDACVARHRAEYTFLEGAKDLSGMLPHVGLPGSVLFIRLGALLHQQRAWFFSHSGMASSTIREGRRSMALWQIAYQESRQAADLEELAKTALISSNARLLQGEPEQALALLDLADEALIKTGARLGSDHYRQRGVAMFQTGSDDQARQMFSKAMVAMQQKGEAQHPVQVAMTGERHSYLLGSIRWEKSQELLDQCHRTFGAGSLEVSMATHWSAACGLSTDSPVANSRASELLEANQINARKFGHQATIATLLSLTPELPLNVRRDWVRRSLYQNAFRNR